MVYANHLHAKLFWEKVQKNILMKKRHDSFSIPLGLWDGTAISNHSPRMAKTCLFHIVNTISADALAPYITVTSTGMVLTHFSLNIAVSAPET